MSFRWEPEPWGLALRCAALDPFVAHLFTSRALPLGAGGAEADAGWTGLATSFGMRVSSLVRLRQVHGVEVVVRRRGRLPASALGAEPPYAPSATGDHRPAADIVVSDDPASILTVQAADCVPLLLADRRSGVVAAVHAGWRGTAAAAAAVAVRTMTQEFGVQAADLVAAIGPSIGPCCYQIGPDLREAFSAAGHPVEDLDRWFRLTPADRGDAPVPPRAGAAASDRAYLDLWRANRDQLVRAGLDPQAVHVAALCTMHDPARLCSYRRDGAAAGRMAGAIRSGAPAAATISRAGCP